MIDYTHILSIHYSGSQWTLDGDSYDGLTWLSESPKPTQAELDALWSATQITVQTQEATRKRSAAYVAEADPLFFKAQRGEATMEDWQAKVEEIKTRYPKPEQGGV